MSEGFGGYLPPKVFSCHNYPQVTPLQHILFFYYTCNEILILKVGTMKELLIAIVDFGTLKQFFVVDPSEVSLFLNHHSRQNLGRSVTVVFQQALEYKPEVFQVEFNKLNKSIDYGNN